MIKEKQKNRKIQRKRKIRCSQANFSKKNKTIKKQKKNNRKKISNYKSN